MTQRFAPYIARFGNVFDLQPRPGTFSTGPVERAPYWVNGVNAAVKMRRTADVVQLPLKAAVTDTI